MSNNELYKNLPIVDNFDKENNELYSRVLGTRLDYGTWLSFLYFLNNNTENEDTSDMRKAEDLELVVCQENNNKRPSRYRLSTKELADMDKEAEKKVGLKSKIFDLRFSVETNWDNR